SELLHDESGAVVGVRIGDMGVARDGSHKPTYAQGIDIRAKVTVLAEGARGHLTKRALRQFKLTDGHGAQNYSIGIKELWQVPAGCQARPPVEMPGAMLIGDTAGLLNVPKIKGTHQAMRSGMMAAEHIASTGAPAGWDAKLRNSPVMAELKKVRNFKPGFKKG